MAEILPKLEPCPFCGGKADLETEDFAATCYECGFSYSGEGFDSLEQLAAKWNIRSIRLFSKRDLLLAKAEAFEESANRIDSEFCKHCENNHLGKPVILDRDSCPLTTCKDLDAIRVQFRDKARDFRQQADQEADRG